MSASFDALVAEASDPTTVPLRLVELANHPRTDAITAAARRNPSLPTETHLDWLEKGDLDAWANPATMFVLLTHSLEVEGDLWWGMVHAMGAWPTREAPDQQALAPALRETLVPALCGWWQIESNPRVLGVYLRSFEGSVTPTTIRSIFVDAIRVSIPPARHAVRAGGFASAASLTNLLDRLEVWVARERTADPLAALQKEAKQVTDHLRKAPPSWERRVENLAAHAVLYATQGDTSEAIRMANAVVELAGDEEAEGAVLRWANEIRAALGRCPLPEGLVP